VKREDPHAADRTNEDRVTNVVRLPVDWLGPREELVPIGPGAEQASADSAYADPAPIRAADFWSEGSAALQDALESPVAPNGLPPESPVDSATTELPLESHVDSTTTQLPPESPVDPTTIHRPAEDPQAVNPTASDPDPRDQAARVSAPARAEPKSHDFAVARQWRLGRLGAALVLLVLASTALGALALIGGSGRRTSGAPDASMSTTGAQPAAAAALAGRLQATMASVSPELQAIARRVPAVRRVSHRGRLRPRRHHHPHPKAQPALRLTVAERSASTEASAPPSQGAASQPAASQRAAPESSAYQPEPAQRPTAPVQGSAGVSQSGSAPVSHSSPRGSSHSGSSGTEAFGPAGALGPGSSSDS